MSLAFTVADAPYPELLLLREVVPEGVRIQEDATVTAWSGGAAWLVLPRRSTRGVPVLWSTEEGLILRGLSLASPDDLRLAARTACAVARARGLPVDDGTGPADPDAVLARWDEDRCRRHALDDAREVLRMAVNGPLRIGAVQRAIRIGPRVRARIGEDPEALIDWVRWTQWPEGEEPHSPRPRPAGGDPGGPTLATMTAGVRTLLPRVELVALHGEPVLIVPRRRLARMLGGAARRFDEDRILVEAYEPAAWEKLRDQAATIAIDDPAGWRPDRPAPADGPLIPVLRPPDWPRRASALCWPISERGDGLPLVSLARDTPRSLVVVDADDPLARDRAAALVRAVEELERRLPPLVAERDDGRVTGLTLTDAFAAEVVLCEERLRRAQSRLGARALLVAVPSRGAVRIQDAFPQDIGAVGRLIAWADAAWREAAASETGTALTPTLLVAVDGRVQGPVRDPTREEIHIDEATLDAEVALRDEPVSGGEVIEDEVEEASPQPVPWQVGVASLVLPGLGHWMLGARRAALGFAVAFVAVVAVLAGVQAALPEGAAPALLPVAVVAGAAALVAVVSGWDAWQRAR